jgi:hypothetical protein
MDPHINSETGESVASGRSPRFNLWCAFLVFSVITLGSAVQVVRLEHRIGARLLGSCYILCYVCSAVRERRVGSLLLRAHGWAVVCFVVSRTI